MARLLIPWSLKKSISQIRRERVAMTFFLSSSEELFGKLLERWALTSGEIVRPGGQGTTSFLRLPLPLP